MSLINLSRPDCKPKQGDKVRKLLGGGAFEEFFFVDREKISLLSDDRFGNWIYNFQIDDDLKDEMIDCLKSLPTVTDGKGATIQEKQTVSTRGDKSIQRMVNPKNAGSQKWANTVNKFLSKVYENAHEIKHLAFLDQFTLRQCWEVSGEEGGHHLLHRHRNLYVKENEAVDGKSLSIVAYLEVPQSNADEGAFVFLTQDDNNHIIPQYIQPKAGDVFVFSPYLIHGTTPQAKGTRRTFNCEVDW